MAIPAEFEFACSFSEGLACASKGQGIGYIDKSGKWVIEPQYTHVDSFHNGQALVWVDDQIGIIDRRNQFVVTPQFDSESSIIKGSPYVALFYKPGREDSQGMRILYKGDKPYYMLPDGSIVE
ncbi:KWG Leptospira [compost metagenome]